MEYYYDSADYNKVIYRQRKEDYNQRLQTILLDADCLLQKCNGGYDDVSEYQLLVRAFSFEKNTGKVRASFNKNNVRTFLSKISAAPGFRIKPEIAKKIIHKISNEKLSTISRTLSTKKISHILHKNE